MSSKEPQLSSHLVNSSVEYAQLSISLPIYSLLYLPTLTEQEKDLHLLIGVGGGCSRSGIANGFASVVVSNIGEKTTTFKLQRFYPTEDTVLSMALSVLEKSNPDAQERALSIGIGSSLKSYRLLNQDEGLVCVADPGSLTADGNEEGYIKKIQPTHHGEYAFVISTDGYIRYVAVRSHKVYWKLFSSNHHDGQDNDTSKSNLSEWQDFDVLSDKLVAVNSKACYSYKLEFDHESSMYVLPSEPMNVFEGQNNHRVQLGKRLSYGYLFITQSIKSRNGTSYCKLVVYKQKTASHEKSSDWILHRTLKAHHKPVTVLALSNDGLYLVMGTSDGLVLIYSALTQKLLWKYTHLNSGIAGITALIVGPFSKWIACSTGDTVHILPMKGVSNKTTGSGLLSRIIFSVLLSFFVLMIGVVIMSYKYYS